MFRELCWRTRGGRAGVAALLAACCMMGVGARVLGAEVEAAPAVGVEIDWSALGLTGGTLVRMNLDTTPGKVLEFSIPIAGEMRQVKMAPHSVRAPGFKLYEAGAGGKLTEVDAGPINTLRGTVDKSPEAVVAGGVMPDGLWATVQFSADEQYWIEPVAARVPGAAADLYVIYTPDQVRQTGHSCGVDEAVHRIGERMAGGYAPRGGTRYTAEVAVEADWEYFNLYGSSGLVNSRISIVYNVVNLQYERDVDIRHAISSTIVNTVEPDPYNQGTTGGMLDEMRLFWVANRGGIGRDLAHLFTGKPTGGVIGTAYLTVVCNTNFGYGVSQTDFNNFNLASASDLIAHETGHNWSSCHCPCSSPAFTMNPFITSINRFGTVADECSTSSIATIVAHRNTRACLTTAATGPEPANDACANARLVGPGTIAWSNVGATTDGPAACGGFGSDVWYFFDAPYDGTVTVDTCGSTFDTTAAAYSGFCGSFTELACNDDSANCGGSPPRQSWIQFTMTRNTRYYVRLGGFNGVQNSGQFTVSFSGCSAPGNNSCGAAAVITDGAYPFTTVCSTTDGFVDNGPGCSAFNYFQTGSDVWFSYTATCSGNINASICGLDRNYDTRIAVYGGCPSGANQAIACNDDSCGTGSSLTWAATQGVTYRIRVGGFNGTQGSGTLVLAPERPSNDACAAALPISAGVAAFGSTLCATNDGSANCAASAASPDVWYSFTPLCTAFYVANTEGASNYDTALSVHNGCPGDLATLVACDDDGGTGLLSRVVWQGQAGVTYYIRMNGFNNNRGSYQLNLGTLPNDTCANAIFVGNGSYGFSTIGAVTDGLGDGLCFDVAGNTQVNQDIWFGYQATCTGTLDVNTFGSSFDTKLAAYAFASCPPSGALACNDDSGGVQSAISFPVVAGNFYQIRVGGYQAATGCGTLTIACRAPGCYGACVADFDDGSGTGTPDGGTGIEDLLYYLSVYDSGAVCADVDDGSGTNTLDGGVGIEDLLYYLTRYDAGC